MTPIFLDIEVLQQEPEAFMVSDPEDLDKLRERSSLDPLLGGIVVVVGLATSNRQPTLRTAPTMDEAGELELLTWLEQVLLKVEQPVFVAWNGSGYDFPFLAKRALRHGLYSLARMFHRDKPWSKHHCDPFTAWQQHSRSAKGRLVDVAQFLGLPVDPDEIGGADVTTAIHDGRMADVMAHCAADVVRLREVYWRLRTAGWLDGQDVVPDELPVRPPRVHPALAEAKAMMVPMDKGTIKRAAEEAGIEWAGKPPLEDGPLLAGVAIGRLQRFIANLRKAAEPMAADPPIPEMETKRNRREA